MNLRQLSRLGRSEQIVFLVALCIWLSACVVVGLNASMARGWPDWTGAVIGVGGGLVAFILLNIPKWKLTGVVVIWPGVALGFLLVLAGRPLLADPWPWGVLLYIFLVLFGGPLLMFGGLHLAGLLREKHRKAPTEPHPQ